MKNFILIIIVLFTSILNAQSGAKIEFIAADNTIDFGTVYKDNDNGIRAFDFTNTGDAPLIIKNVQSTTGCTVVSKPNAPILPGKTGKIEIKYNMNPGAIRKTITVETNATNQTDGNLILKIKGEVLQRNP